MDDNERLKDKFQKLHKIVVGQNLSAVADHLFSVKIISAENMEDLRGSCHGAGGWVTDQSRRLMTLLHRSGHPRAFTELRRALDAEDSTKFIVDKLDQAPVDEQLTPTYMVDPGTRCQCPSCGYAHQSVLAAKVSEYTKKEITILFLGETGVGKSTLINALATYLHFSTLSDAEAAGGFFPIPITFSVTDPVTYRRRTISTGYDANEVNNGEGGSVTLCPTAYVLNLQNIRVNFVDTPGVKSTHGNAQDKINAHNVLTFVSAYEKIDLICVVVKPNEARLTENVDNCLREILRNLHDSACSNVVFCVTRSKASNYGPGDTYGVLAAFCSKQPKLRDLELSPSTVYCFENETVRYLAECTHGDDEEERRSVEQSWRKSVETTKRLLQLAMKVKPHSVIETISLNNARRMIVALCQPLVQTAKCVAVNVRELKRAREKIAYELSTDLSGGRVEILVRRFRFVQLPYSANVCTSSECCTIDKGIMYERVCHDHCRWSPTIRMCRVFNAGGNCIHCGCSYKHHMWSTCVPEVTYEKMLVNIGEIERRKNQSMDEVATLSDRCAKLAAFLRDNSFFETLGGDVILDSVQRELETLTTSGCNNDRQTQTICDGLHRFLATYNECVTTATTDNRKYSPSNIQEIIDELFELPLNGPELKQGANIVQTSTDSAVKKRQKVFYINSCMFK